MKIAPMSLLHLAFHAFLPLASDAAPDPHDGRIQKLTVRVKQRTAKQWRFLWIFWWIMKLGSCRFNADVDAIRPSDQYLKSWNDAYTLNNAWNWSILQFQMSDKFFKIIEGQVWSLDLPLIIEVCI